MKKLDDLIAAYEVRLGTLKNLRSLLATDPDLVAEILSALTSKPSPASAPSAREKPTTQFGKVVAFLGDGQWRTVLEIADAIHARKTSVAPLFCRNPDWFEKRKHPEFPGRVQWRLKVQHPQSGKETSSE